MKRGFGDNRDGSILRDGFRMALPSNFSATTDRVEVLKGPSSMLYGVLDPGGWSTSSPRSPNCSSAEPCR